MSNFLTDAIGISFAAGIRQWVRLRGKKITADAAPWLQCPMGPSGRIGAEFYQHLAEHEKLSIQPDPGTGLLPNFEDLRGPSFDPDKVHPAVRDFYEHTACYRLEAWSEALFATKIFLWLLTTISRRMDQLNFPTSSLELAGGMSSEILPMVDDSGRRVYTGWLRRLLTSGRVIYTGLYAVQRPANYDGPCVKVSFPLPRGSSTVFLRPKAEPDGSLKLISAGRRFGDPGYYRMVELKPGVWKVWYVRTLQEFFHVSVDGQGVLRTEHTVKFMGLTPLRLHYKLERVA